jgi:hypothetical protein
MTRPLATPPRTCEHCGQTFERRPNQEAWQFNRQRFCGNSCSARWKVAHTTHASTGNLDGLRAALETLAAKREQTLEDLEWIIGTDSPENVAHRLGYASVKSLERVLHRWGRPDLASRLQAVNAA